MSILNWRLNMNTIGSRMKYLRKQMGLKQIDFANRVLVSASYISKVESDKELPSNIFTKLVALEFNISYEWLKDGIGDMQINKTTHDFFERNITTSNTLEEITELNHNFGILLKNSTTFKKMCISEICHSISSILQTDVSEAGKILLIELLSDYLGNIKELIEKLYMVKNVKDYSDTSNYYISSYIKDTQELFNDLSNLIIS